MSVKVIGTVIHSGEKNFPVFIDSDGRVAFCIVADTTARDAIASYRRTQGLHAYVISEDSTYILGADLTTWALKDASDYILSTEKGAPNGVAPLNANGKIDGSYLQSLFINAAIGVADIAAMLAVSSVAGNLFVVEDASADPDVVAGSAVYYKNNNDNPADLADFLRLDFGSSVISVNGEQGVITISISSLLSDPTNVTDFNTQVAASDYALTTNGVLSTIQSDISQLESDVAELQTLDVRFRGEFVLGTLYNADEYVVDATADGKAIFKVLITNNDTTTNTITHFEKVKEYHTISETDALLSDKADLVSGKVPVEQLPLGDLSERIFDDYTALIAATGVQTGEQVYVKDATGDPSITEGSAKYTWNGAAWEYLAGSNIVPYSTFATTQGLAASALQSGDNISELVNDAGYTTYDSTGFNADLATKTTDDLAEGTTNKYLTGNEFQKTTDDLDDISEGVTNKHFTSTEKTKLTGITENANNYVHPNHTGDVTSTGDGATVIANDVVTNTKLANMATKTYKGRTSAATGDPEDIPVATLKTDLNLTKSDVGLSNVDNTSDINKPVSTAQQTALNLKLNLGSNTSLENLDEGIDDYSAALLNRVGQIIRSEFLKVNELSQQLELSGTVAILEPNDEVTNGNFGIKTLEGSTEAYKLFDNSGNWESWGTVDGRRIKRINVPQRKIGTLNNSETIYVNDQVAGLTEYTVITITVPTSSILTVSFKDINVQNIDGNYIIGRSQFAYRNAAGTISDISFADIKYAEQYSTIKATDGVVTASDSRFDCTISGTDVIIKFFNIENKLCNINSIIEWTLTNLPVI